MPTKDPLHDSKMLSISECQRIRITKYIGRCGEIGAHK